jgi:eukaryotic-like serine/threonine-protein kinase
MFRACVPALMIAASALLHAAVLQRTVKVNARDGLTYVWIAPGSFAMGCSSEDKECFVWEKPARQLKIDKGFWIGKTEVTQEAYWRVMRTNPSRYKGAHLPVEQVGWMEARRYCEAVGMRLPTEAEWEYAAHGDDPKPRYGSLPSIAWYDANSSDKTHEVGQKEPNGFGLYDMLGNVWEWVEDSYQQNPSWKILKGASFYNLARELRASNRLWSPPDRRHRDMGIRCAGD